MSANAKRRIGNKEYEGEALFRREAKLKYSYGLSIQDYNDMFDAQSGVCACCKNPDYNKQLAVDHCHKTGRNRALLCHQCNNNLGIYEKWGDQFSTYLKEYGHEPNIQ